MRQHKVLYHPSGKVEVVDAEIVMQPEITSGFYKIIEKSMGPFTIREVAIDTSVDVPTTALEIGKEYLDIDYIFAYFSSRSKEIHKQMNLKHKIGILLHGIQGTGKTTVCYAISEKFVKTHDCVVITVSSYNEFSFAIDFLKDAKEKIGDFMSIIIFDECEDDMRHYENAFKRLLDSSSSVNNHINFFTSNDISDISETILNRPSRIKFVLEIGGIKEEHTVHKVVSLMNSALTEEIRLEEEEVKSLIPTLTNKTLDEIKNFFLDAVFDINLKRDSLKSKVEQIMQ